MLRAKERAFAPLCNLTVEDLVPADHFYRQLEAKLYRHLEAKLDLSFVRRWAREAYAERGRPAVDPVVFFKLQLVMFFEGIRSERQLMRVAAARLSVRWCLGYDLDEALPDHSSLTKIRRRYGLAIFRRFFEAIVEQCREAGLVWGKELYFDATQVDAGHERELGPQQHGADAPDAEHQRPGVDDQLAERPQEDRVRGGGPDQHHEQHGHHPQIQRPFEFQGHAK